MKNDYTSICQHKADANAEICGNKMRMRYAGNDPENGPAHLMCADDHSLCEGCGAPCGGPKGCQADICDECQLVFALIDEN